MIAIKENIGIKGTNIFDYFADISRTETIEEIEEKYKKGEEFLENELEKQQEEIDNEFDGNIEWYITENILDLKKFNPEIAEFYSKKIKDEIGKISREIDKETILDILKRLDTTSFNFVQYIFSDKEIEDKGDEFIEHWNKLNEEDKFKKVIEQIVNKDNIYHLED